MSRTTPKGTKPPARTRRHKRPATHWPLPSNAAAMGIVSPGAKTRACSCGAMFIGRDAQRSLALHVLYGPRPTMDPPCCQRWDLDEASGWRTVRTCEPECGHDHEHF